MIPAKHPLASYRARAVNRRPELDPFRHGFERFGDRSRRPGKVEENANGLDIHLCRDVQPEQRIVRLCRGQLEEPILGSDRQADIILR